MATANIKRRIAALEKQVAHRKDEKAALLEKTDGHCAYCGKEIKQGETWHRDHVTPRSQGGRWKDNLIPACPVCNVRKAGSTPDEFRQWLRCHAWKHLLPVLNDEKDRTWPFLSSEDRGRFLALEHELLEFLGTVSIHFYVDDQE